MFEVSVVSILEKFTFAQFYHNLESASGISSSHDLLSLFSAKYFLVARVPVIYQMDVGQFLETIYLFI